MDLPTPPPPPSLIERLRERAAQRGTGPDAAAAPSWQRGAAIALLLAAGPALTIVGADVLTMRARDDSAALSSRTAGPAHSERRRRALMTLLLRPGAATTLETLARVLPADAVLLRAERSADGRLALEVLAPDPDRLRAALRRDPATAMLHDAGQRSGDGGIVVALAEAP